MTKIFKIVLGGFFLLSTYFFSTAMAGVVNYGDKFVISGICRDSNFESCFDVTDDRGEFSILKEGDPSFNYDINLFYYFDTDDGVSVFGGKFAILVDRLNVIDQTLSLGMYEDIIEFGPTQLSYTILSNLNAQWEFTGVFEFIDPAATPTPPTSSVSEPSLLILMTLGFCSFALIKRRRNSSIIR